MNSPVAISCLFLLTFLSHLPLPAQEASTETIALLKQINPSDQVIAGQWSLTEDGLNANSSVAARIELAGNAGQNYSLTVDFTRRSGDDSLGLILPVSNVSPALEISAWQGAAHGLSRVDSLPTKAPANPTNSTPGLLQNGKRYQLFVSVTTNERTATIMAELNGKPLFDWTGEVSRLQPNLVMNLPTPGTIGLFAHNSEVTFHKVTLERRKQAPSSKTSPPVTVTATGKINLASLSQPETPGWEPFNGARFADNGNAISSLSGAGTGDRGAYLKGPTFSEGTIEVELKGTKEPQSSFVGIVFHGDDGETYDAIYFRPFNFGHSDEVRRGHAVQYISHPDWPWRTLRQQQPEEFENPVSPEPEPEEWFRARIVVTTRNVKVFVNDAEEPSLEVDKLSAISDGKVGLWFNGNASFRNLKISP